VRALVATLSLTLIVCQADADALAPKEATQKLIHPPEKRQQYPIVLLKKALAATGEDFQLVASKTDYGESQMRSLSDLANDRGIDVSWSMTSTERERALLPIRIPLMKGLIGWRLPLVKRENVDMFKGVQSVEGLKKFQPGQMHDWPDTPILEWSGIRVFGSNSYEGLFKMLAMGRIDYFPRSAIEIWSELEQHVDLDIAVASDVVIRYPTAMYYFVHPSRKDLHRKILSGLQTIIENGDFDRTFNQYYEGKINRAKLDSRRIIHIKNPLLPKNTPVDTQALWYQIESQ